jgi:hypothetical protein
MHYSTFASASRLRTFNLFPAIISNPQHEHDRFITGGHHQNQHQHAISHNERSASASVFIVLHHDSSTTSDQQHFRGWWPLLRLPRLTNVTSFSLFIFKG